MSFYKTAIQTIAYTVSRDAILSGPILNNASAVNHAAGLESHFMAEMADLGRTLTLSQANELCLSLYEKFRNRIKTPNKGKAFTECYDVESITPRPEYYKKYVGVISEIHSMASQLKN